MSLTFFANTQPRPLKIIELSDEQRLVLNDKNLKSILFHPKAQNKPVILKFCTDLYYITEY
jgi:hypothetical protein